MTEREQLELAARACGFTLEEPLAKSGSWAYQTGAEANCGGDLPIFKWNPLHDQADSDRMGCDLELALYFAGGRVHCAASDGLFNVMVSHNNTIEGRRVAVRKARMLVAAEIGWGT